MGDWYYYVTILKFKDVAERVKLPSEINKKYEDPNLQLSEWIQREVDRKRLQPIVNYLKTEQRFFNSLILGIYDGKPRWHDIDFKQSEFSTSEEEINYFSSTFGILSLDGDESIFAIDGQHRAMGIRYALKDEQPLIDDEIAAIFIAHKATADGNMRTRRLFSTLNRYAKPVSPAETIALSEDDNNAIIARRIVDSFSLLQNRISTSRSRSIYPSNTGDFTNIMVLYDMVKIYLTDRPVFGMKVSGYPDKSYGESRVNENQLAKDQQHFEQLLTRVFQEIPALLSFVSIGGVNRKDRGSSLLFRPIGQIVFISVLKVMLEHNKLKIAIDFFSAINFSFANPLWGKVFYDESTGDINTDKTRQRFATLLIIEHLGLPIRRSSKYLEALDAFGPELPHLTR